MKKVLIYVAFVLCCGLCAVAQGVVSGTVTDGRSGQPIEMVNVGQVGTSRGTTTTRGGRYTLRIITADSIVLRYSYTGYEPQQVALRLRSDTVINLSLKPVAQSLGEVDVIDERTRHSSFTGIDAERIEAAVGPAAGVESLLKTLPDVNSSNELSSQYSVRGGSFDENLVYINGVEVFRPMLIRSGQQEGMSIINPDLVSNVLFSPGGFEASYGDKMSSVLDISYLRPQAFSAKLSASLLGASASVQGRVGQRFSYAAALRQHSNRYLLSSLDTRGSYTTSYTDLQAVLGYTLSPRLELQSIVLLTRNVYGLVPESATTAFGGYQQAMQLDVYFDGAEEDRYRTALAAIKADYTPNDDWHLAATLSAQSIAENERYDVQSQYWLYEVGMGQQVGEVERFDRGVGTFLEHARNRLQTNILCLGLAASRYAPLGSWQFGAKVQAEGVSDRLREWRWVDSAGYSVPASLPEPGLATNMPQAPALQQYANSAGGISTLRSAAYVQREVNYHFAGGAELRLLAGIRAGMYGSTLRWYDSLQHTGLRHTLSPRLSASLKPALKTDLLFRLSTGIYQQAPFYREYRRADGTLNPSAQPQSSYQVMGTADWNLRLWQRPFKITADVFYKYITGLIPYTVDNLRITYHPDLQAVGYATGLSIRVNGDLVEGLESWASLSIMSTREDILTDTLGFIPRPTDQRFAFKTFVQDYIPSMPWWRMSLSLIYATGTPISLPNNRRDVVLRLPSYLRIDWGNTVQLSRIGNLQHTWLMQHVADVQLGVEVFNLFNIRNVVSYLWVTDYENHPYRVPNYLTARQINVKLTILF